MTDQLVAADFFCGAGGMTRGFIDAGIPVRIGIDIDPTFQRTYELNNPQSKFIVSDITRLGADMLSPYLEDTSPENQVFIACAPCQPFTKLRTNPRSSQAGRLLAHFARVVLALRPAFLVIENVPGITRVGGLSTFRRLVKTLETAGYKYRVGVLDAKDYGVPQTRRRLLLIASRLSPVELPAPTHGTHAKSYLTVRSAIERFPPIAAGEAHRSIPNHAASGLSPLNLDRIKHTPHNGGSRADWPKSLRLGCHNHPDVAFTDVYGRMNWDLPAATMTCRCNSLSNGRFGHPEQDRAISLREAASLQGFADTYVFHGPSRASLAAQIGNAVPVGLGKAIGRQVRVMSRDVPRPRKI